MRLIHLSDLHLNPTYNQVNITKTKLVLTKALEVGFDHLVITGDITHDADEESFLIFRNILKDFNLLDSDKTTIIIGNHDIYGGVYSVKELIAFPERCQITDYQTKVSEFVNYFEELFIDCYFPSKKNIFPFAKIINDYVLIGINTNDIYSSIKNPFASNGRVSKSELADVKKIFIFDEVMKRNIIVLSHHHFYKNDFEASSSTNGLWKKIESYTLKLRGKKRLLKLFKKNNVGLVLHGHSHENKHYKRKGCEFFNAGGSVDNEDDYKAILNIVDVKEKNIKIFQEEFLLNKNLKPADLEYL